MERFFQAAAAALIAAILGLALSKQGKDWTLILTTLVSCMVLAVAAAYLEPILDFVQRLQGDSRLDGDMLAVILKAVGILPEREIKPQAAGSKDCLKIFSA